MLRALIRLALFPAAFALHLVGPKHVPTRPGIAIDDVPGPARFVIDDGSPGPYHDRGAAARQALVELAGCLCVRLSLRLLTLAVAVVAVWTSVVVRGVREGWWPVLDGFFRDFLRASLSLG